MIRSGAAAVSVGPAFGVECGPSHRDVDNYDNLQIRMPKEKIVNQPLSQIPETKPEAVASPDASESKHQRPLSKVLDEGRNGAKTPAAPGTARPREIGGPKGPEPTRYGDWEKNGRCIDF